MNLLQLCLSPGFGGLELYAFKVIQYYQNKGIRCVPVVGRGAILERKLTEKEIPCYFLRTRVNFLPVLAARSLARLIDKHAIDTVHIHWRGDLTLAVLAKKFCHRPIRLVYTRQMALTRPKFDPFHRFLYRNVDTFLVITKQLQNEALRYLPIAAEKVQLLYYGVPDPGELDQKLCAKFLAPLGSQRKVFTVGLFGRIEHGKGQHLLVEAIRLISSRGCEVHAALIGHVMDQAYFDGLMRDVKSAGLSERVAYLGFHDNPPSVMGCFDAVILATKAETFGLVLAEAMRAGTAVIGSNAGGVPEIIKHEETGLLFEPENAEDLAKCIERLATDSNLKDNLARRGKEFADSMFSEERHFLQLNAFLDGSAERLSDEAKDAALTK